MDWLSSFEPGGSFELLQTNKLAEDDMSMATPALAGDRLPHPHRRSLYCIRKK